METRCEVGTTAPMSFCLCPPVTLPQPHSCVLQEIRVFINAVLLFFFILRNFCNAGSSSSQRQSTRSFLTILACAHPELTWLLVDCDQSITVVCGGISPSVWIVRWCSYFGSLTDLRPVWSGLSPLHPRLDVCVQDVDGWRWWLNTLHCIPLNFDFCLFDFFL